jgi:hypothetical protein
MRFCKAAKNHSIMWEEGFGAGLKREYEKGENKKEQRRRALSHSNFILKKYKTQE